jgi:hypothetical protein
VHILYTKYDHIGTLGTRFLSDIINLLYLVMAHSITVCWTVGLKMCIVICEIYMLLPGLQRDMKIIMFLEVYVNL